MLAGIKKMFGYFELKIDDKTTVGDFKTKFEKAFSTKVRLYNLTKDGKINSGKGSSVADGHTLLKNISAGNKASGTITVNGDLIVSAVEKMMAEQFGIGIQILTPDGSTFAPNSLAVKAVKDIK
jgi:hypothetical protein